MDTKCFKCGELFPEGMRKCPNCGNWRFNQSRLARKIVLDRFPMPLKWFRFLIYISLFASALLSLYSCYSSIDFLFFDSRRFEQHFYDSPSTILSIIWLPTSLTNAIFSLIVRHRLANFKKEGPTLYFIYRCTSFLLYDALRNVIDVIDAFTSADSPMDKIDSLLMCTVVFVLVIRGERSYFKKRRVLFETL